VLDADPDHPIVIFPERYHHVVVNSPVSLLVEFYKVDKNSIDSSEKQGDRPGTKFVS